MFYIRRVYTGAFLACNGTRLPTYINPCLHERTTVLKSRDEGIYLKDLSRSESLMASIALFNKT